MTDFWRIVWIIFWRILTDFWSLFFPVDGFCIFTSGNPDYKYNPIQYMFFFLWYKKFYTIMHAYTKIGGVPDDA